MPRPRPIVTESHGTRPPRYPLARPALDGREREYLLAAFDSGRVSSSGHFVDKFEREFSAYIGTRHGITVSNGTAALHLALMAAEVGRYDEVVVPDLSFVAPANMVRQVCAKPVFADCNKAYWGVDIDTVKKCITKKTRAVIVVHLYGHPVDLDPILEFCQSRSIVVIEDCAEAHGARYRGKRVGKFGSIGCFSFYGNKLLTTGEGGMCVTDNPTFNEKLRLLRDHGADRSRHFWHPIVGFNYRMTNLQAAIGCAQLESIERRIAAYRRIGRSYSWELNQAFGSSVTLHPEMDWATCVFWMYTFVIPNLREKKRDELISKLRRVGIETRPMFYPISMLPPYLSGKKNTWSSAISKTGLSLPTYSGLNEEDIQAIVESVVRCFKSL